MARQKDFDTEKVIQESMKVFWRKGFYATSLNDLTTATGLHKGSLYSAFESKEKLFELSLQNYGNMMRGVFIQDECPVKYLKRFFREMIKDGLSGKAESGCLVMNSTKEFGTEKSHKAEMARSLFDEIRQNFGRVLDLAIEQEKVPLDIKKKVVVDRLVGAAFSIRELSKFKRERALLKNVANGALKDLNITIT